MVWNSKCFFSLFLLVGRWWEKGMSMERHLAINHIKSQSQKQRMELLSGAADVIWVHSTFHLKNQLPKSFTFLLTRLSSQFLARIQMQNIWRRPHRMAYRHFWWVGEKNMHVFQPKPIFFTCESLGLWAIFRTLGLDYSEICQPNFRPHLRWLEEYVLASSEKLTSPQVLGYDFNQGLG